MRNLVTFSILALLKVSHLAAAENCKLPMPTPVLNSKDSNFAFYKIKQAPTEVTETGKTKGGLVFTIVRGGCNEFGEIYIFETDSNQQPVTNIKYWIEQSAIILSRKLVQSPNKSLVQLAQKVSKILEKYPEYKYDQSALIEKDHLEIDVAELPLNKTKIQILVNASL